MMISTFKEDLPLPETYQQFINDLVKENMLHHYFAYINYVGKINIKSNGDKKNAIIFYNWINKKYVKK